MELTDTNDVSGQNNINFSKQRSELKGVSQWIFGISAVFFVAVYIYSAGFGSAAEQYHLGLYLLFTFFLIGILYKFRQNSPTFRPSIFDIGLVALSIVSIGYWIIEYPDLANRAGAYTGVDIVMGGIGLMICFEVSRRTVGWGLPKRLA